ncbi:hypothetical protein L7F22_064189, partial [Adiantum nelumboides]|nr:hypothetical protein [Adiantum nelumboides]
YGGARGLVAILWWTVFTEMRQCRRGECGGPDSGRLGSWHVVGKEKVVSRGRAWWLVAESYVEGKGGSACDKGI